jgi:hypothetical protein
MHSCPQAFQEYQRLVYTLNSSISHRNLARWLDIPVPLSVSIGILQNERKIV